MILIKSYLLPIYNFFAALKKRALGPKVKPRLRKNTKKNSSNSAMGSPCAESKETKSCTQIDAP